MNKTKLEKEGKKWVEDGIITEQQLDTILASYTKKDPNNIIILFAVLLTSLAVLTFIFSDWAQVPHISRVIIMIIFMLSLYIAGDILFKKRSTLLGVGFLVLGYVSFGAGMLLVIMMYEISIYNAWPFIIWSVIGLLLYVLYEHKLIFVMSLLVTTVGQIYSGASFSTFNWILLLILVFGFAHFVYHHANKLYSYLFAISFSLNMVILITTTQEQQYYWLIIYFWALYIIGDLIRHQEIKLPFKQISLLSILVFGMYETFLLQEDYFLTDIEYSMVFLIIWFLLLGFTITIKRIHRNNFEIIDLLLFLPVFYFPFSYIIVLIKMFLFSISWLLVGYKKEIDGKIFLGTAAFLLSTFTAYVQYAWDVMNKSLFFLIGGILLFGFSFFLEKKRRNLVASHKGDRKR